MYTAILQNKYGQLVELTHDPRWTVKSIEGLDPPDAVLNMTRDTGSDGSVFNSAYADNRQIIITLAINGPAEDNRITLYRYVKSKQLIRFYYRDGLRDVWIDGYVKSMHIGLFEQKQIAQITLICPDPYFKAVEPSEYELLSRTSGFEFPFSIETGDPIPFSEIVDVIDTDVINPGDVETGVVIRFVARGYVIRPAILFGDDQYFRINFSMLEGSEIRISTIRKQKSVTLINPDGTTTNLIGMIDPGSTWPVFDPADNYISLDASGNKDKLDAYVELTALYEGV